MSRRAEPIDTLLLLAALDRACDAFDAYREDCDRDDDDDQWYGPMGTVGAEECATHMGGGYRRVGDAYRWTGGPTAGRVQAALKRGVRDGLVLEHRPPHGGIRYCTSAEGDDLLVRFERLGELPELPESPEHRAWRTRREGALAEVDALRVALRDAAMAVLDAVHADDPAALAHPDPERSWHNIGEPVERIAERLADALRAIAAPEPHDSWQVTP